MDDPRWLEEDKTLVEIIDARPFAPEFAKKAPDMLYAALKRAHAAYDELRVALKHEVAVCGVFACTSCEKLNRLLDRQEPPEVQ